jgi:hypothetical protein
MCCDVFIAIKNMVQMVQIFTKSYAQTVNVQAGRTADQACLTNMKLSHYQQKKVLARSIASGYYRYPVENRPG